MTDIAIRAEHLSKQYKIGLTRHHANTLRDQLAASVKALVRRHGSSHAGKEAIWALKDVSFEVERGQKVPAKGPVPVQIGGAR